MRVLVTGGTGFVLSNVVRHLLETIPQARVVVLDLGVGDELAADFFAPLLDRLQLVAGDVRDGSLLRSLSRDDDFTHVVHGATVTHDPEIERRDPTRYLDVNLNGTVSVLEWLRSLPRLERCIHVSTGGVYGQPTPQSPVESQPETGPFDPPELYAVSKYAAELVVRRYAVLFGLPACRIRLSDVFGPMERPTGARASSSMSLPYRMMHALTDRRPLRVSQPSMEAAGDFLSAQDIAVAVTELLTRTTLAHEVFNIAAGRRIPVPELFATFHEVAPDFRYEIVEAAEAEVNVHPGDRLARFNAYSISRIAELDWRPRPLDVQLKSYLDWVLEDPQRRCP